MQRLDTAVEAFVEWKGLFGGRNGKSKYTLRAYRGDLKLFLNYIKSVAGGHAMVRQFTQEMVEGWLAQMEGLGLSRATIARRQSSVRELAKWGVIKRHWPRDPTLDTPTIGVPERLPRPFAPSEVDALMAVVLDHEGSALRALLYYAGPREAEVCGIQLGDLTGPSILADGSKGAATVRLLGKGNKERIVPLHDDCWRALEEHVNERPKDDRTRKAFLFQQRLGSAWTPYMICQRVKAWGKVAGVEKCTPHRFRHSFGTDTMEATDGDIRTVQLLMGHASIQTTAGYAKVSDRRKAEAVQKLRSFPSVVRADCPSAVPEETPIEEAPIVLGTSAEGE